MTYNFRKAVAGSFRSDDGRKRVVPCVYGLIKRDGTSVGHSCPFVMAGVIIYTTRCKAKVLQTSFRLLRGCYAAQGSLLRGTRQCVTVRGTRQTVTRNKAGVVPR